MMPRRTTIAELGANPPRFSEDQRARLDLAMQTDADAKADADDINPTWSEEQLERAVFARDLRMLRETLGLTQARFAERYRIGAARLRDWEQARSRPDTAAMAYITLIKRDPRYVEESLRLADTASANQH